MVNVELNAKMIERPDLHAILPFDVCECDAMWGSRLCLRKSIYLAPGMWTWLTTSCCVMRLASVARGALTGPHSGRLTLRIHHRGRGKLGIFPLRVGGLMCGFRRRTSPNHLKSAVSDGRRVDDTNSSESQVGSAR